MRNEVVNISIGIDTTKMGFKGIDAGSGKGQLNV